MLGILCNPGQGLQIVSDLPIPTPKEDETLIKVVYCGVCGTDLHIMDNEFITDKRHNLVLGHEIVGYCANDTKRKVFVNPNGACGSCQWCQIGSVNFCKRTLDTGGIGLARDGGWGEFLVAPTSQLTDIPVSLDLLHGVLIEPLSCIVRGVDRIEDSKVFKLHSGTKTLIIGAGIIGLLWVVVLHQRGISSITVSEPSDSRLSLVNKFNLIGVKGVQPNELEKQNFDLVVECSGNVKAIESVASNNLAKGATLCLFGCSPAGAKLKLPYDKFVINEIRTVACRINPHTTPRAIALTDCLAKLGYLDFEKLGIKIMELEKYEEAINLLRTRVCSKVVFKVEK